MSPRSKRLCDIGHLVDLHVTPEVGVIIFIAMPYSKRTHRVRLQALFVVVAIYVFAIDGTARAQTLQPSSDRPLFYASLTLGLGDCDQRLCGDQEGRTSPFLGAGAKFLIRPIPYFAAGAELHHNWMLADDRDQNREGEIASYFLANLVVRGILPLDRFEPWAGFGFGYGWWGYSWDKDNKDEDVTVDGLNFAFQGGADYWLTEAFTLGAEMRISLPSWSDRCKEKIEVDKTKLECRDFDSLDQDDQDELPNLLWYFGATVGLGFG